MYLPSDDRRHYVAWSELTKDDFTTDYWNELWGFYDNGGDADVAAYLATLDISKFNPKAPPPKTIAFWDIVEANRAPEQSELADTIDNLDNPDVLTIELLASNTTPEFEEWLRERRNRRIIPFQLENCGYVMVRNEADKRDGQWKIGNKRQTVYAKAALSIKERCKAAQKLKDREDKKDTNKRNNNLGGFREKVRTMKVI